MPKILFLAANPADSTPLQLDEEMRAIDQALRMAEFRSSFELYSHWAVRYGDLTELLLRHTPQIVHFSGHGSDAGEIVLAASAQESHAVAAAALGRLFGSFKHEVRCVVLNACFSEAQAQAIAEHIECVLGMSGAVADATAIDFSASFYLAIGYGRSVQTAFDLACARIDLAGLQEGDMPKLLARGDAASIFLAPEAPPGSTGPAGTPGSGTAISGQVGDLGAGAQAAIGTNIRQSGRL